MLKVLTIAFFSLWSLSLTSQLDYSDRKGGMDLESISPLFLDKKVSGYVSTVSMEQKNKMVKIVSVLNVKADELFNFEIENAQKTYLLESAYNGFYYAFLFIDVDSRKLSLKLYDSNGIWVSETIKNMEKSVDLNFFTSHVTNNNSYSGYNYYLHEVGADGFILLHNTVENGLNICRIYKINEGQPEQIYQYKSESTIHESKFLGASARQYYFTFEKDAKIKNQYTADIIALDKKSFEQKFEIFQTDNQDFVFFPQAVLTNTKDDSIRVVGYYFNSDKDMYNQFYDGYGYWKLEPKGDFISEKYISFQKDIFDLKFNKDNKGKEVGYLLMQDVFSLGDDKIYIVSEGYNKSANGAAISYSIMGSGYINAYTRIKTLDMAVLEFDSDFSYRGTSIIEKSFNSLQLNYSLNLSTFYLGKLFNQYGMFDYLFTEKTSDNTFSVYFKNYNQYTNGGRNYVIGRYTIDNGNASTSKIEKLPNTNKTYFMPNINGRIMFVEWIKKKIYFEFKK